MGRIIAYFLEFFTVKALFNTIYFTGVTALIAGYVAFILWFFNVVSEVFGYIQSAIDTISAGGGAMSSIYSILDCMGFWSGFNAGFPLVATALSTVLLIFVSREFYKFSVIFWNFISSALKR
jgi:hypothetical protein